MAAFSAGCCWFFKTRPYQCLSSPELLPCPPRSQTQPRTLPHTQTSPHTSHNSLSSRSEGQPTRKWKLSSCQSVFVLNTGRYRISVICSPRYPCTEQTENRGSDRELLICPVPVSNFSHVKGGGLHLLLALISMELLLTCLNPHNLSWVSPTHLTSTQGRQQQPKNNITCLSARVVSGRCSGPICLNTTVLIPCS